MSDDPSQGFRSQQRFSDPASDEPPEPAGSTDPTPPTGIPASQPDAAPAPYPELSTASLLRQNKRPPSSGWRRALFLASGKLINLGESPKAVHHNNLLGQVKHVYMEAKR